MRNDAKTGPDPGMGGPGDVRRFSRSTLRHRLAKAAAQAHAERPGCSPIPEWPVSIKLEIAPPSARPGCGPPDILPVWRLEGSVYASGVRKGRSSGGARYCRWASQRCGLGQDFPGVGPQRELRLPSRSGRRRAAFEGWFPGHLQHDLLVMMTKPSSACYRAVANGAGNDGLPTYACALRKKIVPLEVELGRPYDIWHTCHSGRDRSSGCDT
jgi:hypothetical protein